MAVVLGLLAGGLPAAGQGAPKDVSFADGVLGVLQKKCLNCHDATRKRGDIDLSTYEATMGVKGMVVPGAPEKSRLYQSVTGATPKMPRNGAPLEKADVDLLAAWIRAGAKNPPPPRAPLASLDEALKTGRDGAKPVVLLFGDGTAKTKLFLQQLSDPSLDASFGTVAYAIVTYEKDGVEAKKFKVSSAPTLLVLDPRPETPKELKKLTSGAPGGVKSAIAAAVKSLAAK
jgi:hypothetical protein